MPKKTTVGSIFIKDVPWHRPEHVRQAFANNVARMRDRPEKKLPSPKQKSPPKRA